MTTPRCKARRQFEPHSPRAAAELEHHVARLEQASRALDRALRYRACGVLARDAVSEPRVIGQCVTCKSGWLADTTPALDNCDYAGARRTARRKMELAIASNAIATRAVCAAHGVMPFGTTARAAATREQLRQMRASIADARDHVVASETMVADSFAALDLLDLIEREQGVGAVEGLACIARADPPDGGLSSP